MAWTTPANMAVGDLVSAACYNQTNVANAQYLKGQAGSVSIEDAVSITGCLLLSGSILSLPGAGDAFNISTRSSSTRITFNGACATSGSGAYIEVQGADYGGAACGGLFYAEAKYFRFQPFGGATCGGVFINESSNNKMTTGLTINQGTADDEILALKSS